MKVKVELSEVRLKELTAELSKKSDESLQLKVMEAIMSVQSGNCFFHCLLVVSLFLQNEVQVASDANNMLTDACDAAVKAKEDIMEKFKVSEVFIGFLLLLLLPFSCSGAFCIKNELRSVNCFRIFLICPQNIVQELEGCLLTEKQTNRDNTFQIEQLKKEIKYHE